MSKIMKTRKTVQTRFKFNSLNNNEVAHGFGDSTMQTVPLTHTVHGSTSPALY